MKKNTLFLICFSAFLVACDSATVTTPGATNSNGGTTTDGTDDGLGNNTGDGTGDGAGTDNGTDDGTGNGTDGGNGTDNGTNGGTGTGSSSGTGLDGITTSSTANGIVNSVGLIKLEPIGISTDTTRGLFGTLPSPRSETEIRDWYMPPTDECIVTVVADQPATADAFQVRDQAATLVSAGESIVLTDANGTYATLQRTDGPAYQPQADLSQAAGANLTVDIPGDQFAAFPNVAVPTVPALQFTSPATDAVVTSSTSYQWTANNVPGSIIEVYTGGISSATNQEIIVGCSVVDDGQFTFPQDIQARMGTDYSADWASALRIVYNVAAEDDAIVFIANSVKAN